MRAHKEKIIVVVGPTASGKSELAVFLAKKLHGEIISADSRQIYRGLSIGSGKVPGRWKRGLFIYKGVPHHMVDRADPRRVFTANDFQTEAKIALRAIRARNNVPIIAGGTGFYINALVYGLTLPHVPPNWPLRKQLEKKTPARLFTMLRKVDPRRAKTIDRRNPHRLIRALEIVRATGRRIANITRKHPYDTLMIGIMAPQKSLEKKIAHRLHTRMKSGMIREVRRLRARGISHARLRALGLEYGFCSRYLEGAISKKELQKTLQRAIVNYAKRQMTWFAKNPEIVWVSAGTAGTARAVRLSHAFLTEKKSTGRIKNQRERQST